MPEYGIFTTSQGVKVLPETKTLGAAGSIAFPNGASNWTLPISQNPGAGIVDIANNSSGVIYVGFADAGELYGGSAATYISGLTLGSGNCLYVVGIGTTLSVSVPDGLCVMISPSVSGMTVTTLLRVDKAGLY